jgi:hypothetical protein
MEKKTNEKQGVKEFINKHKKWLLLLLISFSVTLSTIVVILGGSPTSSSPSTSNPSSSTTSSSSATTTSSPSSDAGPFSGSEVPNWDFSNPVISADGIFFDLGFDRNLFTSRQGDYLVGVGGVYKDDMPENLSDSTQSHFLQYTIRIKDLKTDDMLFEYTFDSGSDYYASLLDKEPTRDLGQSFTNFVFDGQQTIYVVLNLDIVLFPDFGGQEFYVRRGSFSPVIDAILELNSNFLDQPTPNGYESLFLKFNLNNSSSYELLGFRSRSYRNVFQGLYLEDNALYGFLQPLTQPGSFQNSVHSFPSLTNFPTSEAPLVEANTIFKVKFNIGEQGTLTQDTSFAYSFGTTSNSNLLVNASFAPRRQGFNSVFRNDENKFFLSINFMISQGNQSLAVYEDFVLNSDFSFLPSKDGLNEFLDEVRALHTARPNFFKPEKDTLMFPNFIVQGTFNPETGYVEQPLFSFSDSDFDNATFSSYTIQFFQTKFYLNNGDLVLSKRTSAGYSNGLNEFDVYEQVVTLIPSDGSPQTEILNYTLDDDFIFANLYEKEGGYYLSGTLAEGSTYPTVTYRAAVLIELDDSFNETNRIVLNGSGHDIGSSITLNTSLRPIWLVTSNSIDGDFAFAATMNPNRARRTYAVTFG